MSTIRVPELVPSPEEDCNNLHKAFKGWGTDEKAIIEILGRRTALQRRKIANSFEQLLGKSLVDELHSELSGDFRKAVILWVTDPAERDARLANESLKKKGDQNVWTIIEIACASTPDHLIAVRQAYCSVFLTSLEEDIESRFSQETLLKQLLVRLVSSYRYSGELVHEGLAKTEAARLHDAVEKNSLHNDEVVRILGIRSKTQLKETFKQYKQAYGKSLDEDIQGYKGTESKFMSMLKVAVWCIDSPEKHFAEVIRTSILGLGTDEDMLTRAIVTRAEVDMKNIKEEYKIRFKRTVNADVIGDTSGDYKNFLLTLIGTAD